MSVQVKKTQKGKKDAKVKRKKFRKKKDRLCDGFILFHKSRTAV